MLAMGRVIVLELMGCDSDDGGNCDDHEIGLGFCSGQDEN